MKRMAALIVVAALATAACGSDDAQTVVLLTHDSFLISDEVLAEFTDETGLSVEVRTAGDAGSMVNQAILTRDNPIADVMYGVDNTFLGRAQSAGIFERYTPAGAGGILPELTAGTGGLVTPIDYGDVCINIDLAAFAELGLEPPDRLDDLARPEYASRLVVQDPTTSSPGLAFLLATVSELGDAWPAFWEDLVAHGVTVAPDWQAAYYGEFSAASDGDKPMVVSYASSPPAEVFFATEPLTEAPTAVVEAGCFRQIEYAGILRGAENREGAEALIDYMLTERFQEDIPLNMFVFPAVADADLPPVFAEHAIIPSDPATLDVGVIEAGRDAWLRQWSEIVRG